MSGARQFVFRGDDILSLSDIPGAQGLDEGISADLFPEADVFEFSMPDGSGPISVIADLRHPSEDQDLDALSHAFTRTPVRTALSEAATLGISVAPFFRALHLARWRADSKYCGRCGTLNTDAADELARLCPSCDRREYPRIAPAVIVLVEDEAGSVLLAHNSKFKPQLYSLIAGFVEAGETLEDAVAREVQEETGIVVADPRYVRSQPWPFPFSLMLGFRARKVGGDLKPDGVEIEEAGWFSREDLPILPGPGSVARWLIDQWVSEGS